MNELELEGSNASSPFLRPSCFRQPTYPYHHRPLWRMNPYLLLRNRNCSGCSERRVWREMLFVSNPLSLSLSSSTSTLHQPLANALLSTLAHTQVYGSVFYSSVVSSSPSCSNAQLTRSFPFVSLPQHARHLLSQLIPLPPLDACRLFDPPTMERDLGRAGRSRQVERRERESSNRLLFSSFASRALSDLFPMISQYTYLLNVSGKAMSLLGAAVTLLDV